VKQSRQRLAQAILGVVHASCRPVLALMRRAGWKNYAAMIRGVMAANSFVSNRECLETINKTSMTALL